VLFNLTNINITERIRELATIKVLGFYDAELAMYIYRENGLVAALGICAGLFGGVWLHRYVLAAAEIDMLMFPQIIKTESFVFSAVLSAGFTVFVNLVMLYKFRKIDMAESLKSVE
jgi:putative ABC transport system permease protein